MQEFQDWARAASTFRLSLRKSWKPSSYQFDRREANGENWRADCSLASVGDSIDFRIIRVAPSETIFEVRESRLVKSENRMKLPASDAANYVYGEIERSFRSLVFSAIPRYISI